LYRLVERRVIVALIRKLSENQLLHGSHALISANVYRRPSFGAGNTVARAALFPSDFFF
jgi:hypothetical protein